MEPCITSAYIFLQFIYHCIIYVVPFFFLSMLEKQSWRLSSNESSMWFLLDLYLTTTILRKKSTIAFPTYCICIVMLYLRFFLQHYNSMTWAMSAWYIWFAKTQTHYKIFCMLWMSIKSCNRLYQVVSIPSRLLKRFPVFCLVEKRNRGITLS